MNRIVFVLSEWPITGTHQLILRVDGSQSTTSLSQRSCYSNVSNKFLCDLSAVFAREEAYPVCRVACLSMPRVIPCHMYLAMYLVIIDTDDLRDPAVSTSTFRQSLKTHLFSAYQHV